MASICSVASTRCVPGSSALAVWVRLCGSTPMMAMNDLRSDTMGSGTAGDMPTSSTGREHTSVESGRGPEHRPARQTLAEPTRRWQAVHEPSRSMSRRHARSPTRASRALIQVGGSAWARPGVVDEAATDEAGGGGEAAVAEPGGPPQPAMKASANRSVPRGRQVRSRQRLKASDSPHCRQRLDENELTAVRLLDSASSHPAPATNSGRRQTRPARRPRLGCASAYFSTPSSIPPASQARSWLGVASTWWTGS